MKTFKATIKVVVTVAADDEAAAISNIEGYLTQQLEGIDYDLSDIVEVGEL